MSRDPRVVDRLAVARASSFSGMRMHADGASERLRLGRLDWHDGGSILTEKRESMKRRVEVGHRRLALFYPYRYWATFAALDDLCAILGQAGWEIDLFAPATPGPASHVEGSFRGVKVRHDRTYWFDRQGLTLPSVFKWHGGRPVSFAVIRIVRPLRRALRDAAVHLGLGARRDGSYVCCMGFDQEGLSAAARLAIPGGIAFAYWSLEVPPRCTEQDGHVSAARRREIRLHRLARFSVTQDSWRAALLARENQVDASSMLLVPNAPSGKASRQRSDWAIRELGVRADQRLVVSAGHLAAWSAPEELIASAAAWPEPYTLLLHSRSPLTELETRRYLRLIDTVGKGRTILSDRRLSRSDYRAMLASCYAGLAYYDPDCSGLRDDNVYVLGLSSGKVADCLQNGLPVVASALPGLADLLTGQDCGVCIRCVSDIGPALDLIERHYTRMTRNACRCFDERLELSRQLQPLLEALDAL